MGKSNRNKTEKNAASQSTGSKLYQGSNNWKKKGLELCRLEESFPVKYLSIEPDGTTIEREIVYHHGKIRFEGERMREVSFIEFESKGHANKIVDMGYGLNHSRVLKPIFAIIDKDLKKPVVCFEKFQCLHHFCPKQDLAKFLNPNSNGAVPGNPIDVIQVEIKELARALQFLHANGLSSSLLRYQACYIWDGTKFKILADVRGVDEQSINDWITRKKQHIDHFREGICSFLLGTASWPQRDSFFNCFTVGIDCEGDRLSMIIDHPFLKNNLVDILEIFSEIHHAIYSQDFNARYGIVRLCGKIFSKSFDKEVLDKAGSWFRQTMHTSMMRAFYYKKHVLDQFGKLKKVPQSHTYRPSKHHIGEKMIGSYVVTTSRFLMTFLRDVFDHNYVKVNNIPLATMFREVNASWPTLLHKLHEYSY